MRAPPSSARSSALEPPQPSRCAEADPFCTLYYVVFALDCAVLYCALPYCAALLRAALCCIVSYLYCTVLHRPVLCHTVLYCTVLWGALLCDIVKFIDWVLPVTVQCMICHYVEVGDLDDGVFVVQVGVAVSLRTAVSLYSV